MLVINAEEQKSLLVMNEVIDSAANALKEFSLSRTVTPVRTSLPFADSQNTALFMPSVAEDLGILGLKVVNVVPGNTSKGKKAINGVVMLSDFETGEPLALLEGSYLTMIRTGALSGVATKYLSRENAKKLCVIGTGGQAEGLVAAVLAVRDIDTVLVYNRTKQKAVDFAEYITKNYNKPVQVYLNPNEAIKEADIIVTATTSSSPVFSEPIKDGVHINAVGSFRPTMQEIPSHVISNADKIVVESREAALEETGDLQIPIQEGVLKESDIYAELGQIISGERIGRESDEERTVFKSVGLAVVDIVVAKYFHDKALKQGVGTRINL